MREQQYEDALKRIRDMIRADMDAIAARREDGLVSGIEEAAILRSICERALVTADGVLSK